MGSNQSKQSANSDQNLESFPQHLQTYDALVQHFRAQLEGLSTFEKGSRFAKFIQKLLPQTELAKDFAEPMLNEKQSHDDGVDFSAKAKIGEYELHGQAKLYIDRVDTLDSIISKFKAYAIKKHAKDAQQSIFSEEDSKDTYLIATLSKLDGIIARYEKSNLTSKTFFQTLIEEGRIHFVHGEQVFNLLRSAYLKISELPTELHIELGEEAIHRDNVYFGIISSNVLKKLHDEFGDALFFENIRDFLGLGEYRAGRSTPNQEIIKTILEQPEKMLERNNGIVIRADRIIIDDSKKRLTLTRGSVINGCQTTMCIVDNAKETCFVPVKIVETSNSWDVAKAANYQNEVRELDLDLARSIRPQLAMRAASVTGVNIQTSEKSAFQIIDEIYSRKATYEETRLLYIGLFSRNPNNLYAANYTELMKPVVDKFYEDDPFNEKTFDTLFVLQDASVEGLAVAGSTYTNEAYAPLFQRFYKEDSPSYRCWVSLLALSGSIGMDLGQRKNDPTDEFERMKRFLFLAKLLLENKRSRYVRYYQLAVKAWMQEGMATDADDLQIRKDMSAKSKRANFTNMYRRLSMDADVDPLLITEEYKFEPG